MLHRYAHTGVTWVDSEVPTEEEIHTLVHEFGLDVRISEELAVRSFKPHLRRFGDVLYLVLHFPALKHTHNDNRRQEIDFVLGRDFLITSHSDIIDPLHKLAKTFEVEHITRDEEAHEDVGSLFYRIMRKLYRSVMHELEFQSDELLEIEAHIFEGQETDNVERLSRESMNLLVIEQTLALHRDLLKDLEKAFESFLGKDVTPLNDAILTEYEKVVEKAATNRGLINELRTTNDTLLITKQNEVMKIFTILAFVTFPLSLVTGIFGMNTEGMPLVDSEYSFWYIVAGMFLATVAFFMYFRYKKWL